MKINYWVIPGKEFYEYRSAMSLPNRNAFISIYTNNKMFISYVTLKYLNAKAGDKLNLIEIGKRFYICKSLKKGFVISKDHNSGYISAFDFVQRIKEVYRYKKKIRCLVKKTHAELDGMPLYEINFPNSYNSILNKINNYVHSRI